MPTHTALTAFATAARMPGRTLTAFATAARMPGRTLTVLADRHSAVALRALTALVVAGALCAWTYGCGKALHGSTAAGGGSSGEEAGGAMQLLTRNTTRIGGASPVGDAAAVALTVYPGLTPAMRPQAAILVVQSDWPAALVASTLSGWPLHAPLLYTEADSLPHASTRALQAMAPTGAAGVEGAQTISIGEAPAPAGYRSRAVRAAGAAALAVSVEQLASTLRRHAPGRVIVTALDAPPAMSAPAAGLAAQSGAPILLVRRNRVPAVTAAELRRLGRPAIYLVGPSSVVDERVAHELQSYGTVTRIGAEGPVENSIAVARFSDGRFGWGIVEPGHGLAFASALRPLDGPAAAPLAATGDYAPLLLLETANRLPAALMSYLRDLQPGTPSSGPVHGVYNHGWLIGDETAISASIQADIDAILQVSSREASEPEAG